MNRRTPPPNSPGARLRALIDAIPAETRPSDREIGRRAGLSRNTVYFVVSGRVPNPGVVTVGRILDAIGKTFADYDAVAEIEAEEHASAC